MAVTGASTRKPEASGARGKDGPGAASEGPVAGGDFERSAGNRAVGNLFRERTSLLVEDSSEPDGAQMQKSEFLAELRLSVRAKADAELAKSGQDTNGCPWIEHWFGIYEKKSAAHVERALQKYAPEAAGARSARDYIPAVANRVGRAVRTWARTGEVTGLPDDMPGGGLLSSFGGLFFKGRDGGAESDDPGAVRAELGRGSPLPPDVRGRMEGAFGTSFGGVQVHTDAKGAQVSDRLNARALTVGEHVAFGSGQFQPNTLTGDALIAHELAHVVQQGAGAGGAGLQKKAGASTNALEADADAAAVGAMTGLFGGFSRSAMPRLKSGLGLSRCATPDPGKGKTTTPKAAGKTKQSVVLEAATIEPDQWKTMKAAATTAKEKTALVQAVLTKSDINQAGEKDTTKESPEDYKPYPAINYDDKLNDKNKYTSGDLKKNAGHSFTAEGKKYVVLGPKVLNNPINVKMTAEHEAYHVLNHLDEPIPKGDEAKKEQYHRHELDASVQDFKKYFTTYKSSTWNVLNEHYSVLGDEARKPYLDELAVWGKGLTGKDKDRLVRWIKEYREDGFIYVEDENKKPVKQPRAAYVFAKDLGKALEIP